MTEHPWTDLLLQQSLLFSAAVLLLALLRPLLRRLLDAGAVYLAWLLVPLLMLSPWTPRLLQGQVLPASMLSLEQAVPVWLKPMATAGAAQPAEPSQRPGADAPARPGIAPQALALGLWASGATALLALLVWRQRRFSERLQRSGRAWIAPAGDSPALLGLWRSQLVLPRDFEQRFSPQEQALILAHEAVHARRHDNAWNLLAAALLVLQWFNPLAWWAMRRMRQDQELACDAVVLNQQQTTDTGEEPFVKTYINALLKSHPNRELPVLSSGWAHQHPLLERLRLLARHRQPTWRLRLGRSSVLGLCLGMTVLAQAAGTAPEQPAQAQVPAEPPQATKGQGLSIELDSQQGSQPWQHRRMSLVLPDDGRLHTHRATMMQFRQAHWCLSLLFYGFPDGTLRPMVEVLDKSCHKTLTGLAELNVNEGPQSLQARLPGALNEALQARISLRWTDPQSPDFVKLLQQSRKELSAEQKADAERYAAEYRKLQEETQAQDKAWRQARGERP